MNQIHENPPTDPTELLYKNNEKVKRRIQIHTNLRYFHHFDTEMTLNQAPVHWLFVFSFFSVFYYFNKHTLSHSENCHFLFIRLRFSDVWVRILDIYATLWCIWSIFSCVWTDVFSAESSRRSRITNNCSVSVVSPRINVPAGYIYKNKWSMLFRSLDGAGASSDRSQTAKKHRHNG